MSIDWGKAPEGATHYMLSQGVRLPWRKQVGGKWFAYAGFGEWNLIPEPKTHRYFKKPSADREENRVQGQIELAKVLISLSGDIRQPINASQAAWMAAQLEELGYRKFEIVEEDV